MEDKAEFAVKVLKQYSKENSVLPRSTSDLSPLESWLILQMFSDQGLRKAVGEYLESTRMKHHTSPDDWYSCPKSEDGCADPEQGKKCNCGADLFNARLDNIIVMLGW